ncbi:MAG: hypothetical protein HFJ50_10360, partial [Clostridia bacterium]|nr:hypothetical protein [Clostridia bacterium]
LTYTLSLNGQTRTATGTSGNYVTFSAVSGLSEYTTYSWTVTVKDTNNASTSATGSDRTYCSGKGAICQYPNVTCSACGGGVGTKVCGLCGKAVNGGPFNVKCTNRAIATESWEPCPGYYRGEAYWCSYCDGYWSTAGYSIGSCNGGNPGHGSGIAELMKAFPRD